MELTIYISAAFLVLYLVGLAIHKVRFARDRKRMQRESRHGGRVVARIGEVRPGTVKKFWLICSKYRIDGFLVNDHGEYHAYVNRCRHMPTPLDFVRDEFFSADGRLLMCYTHGALYEPGTGLCVDGPCKGESLYRLPVFVDGGDVLVGCPTGDLSYLRD